MADKQPGGIEAQSAFASTLITDIEKSTPEASSQKRVMPIVPQPGTDAVYAAKSTLLSQALQDLGMGRYQWSLVLVTSVGWFLSSVCKYPLYYSLFSEIILTKHHSSGSRPSGSLRHPPPTKPNSSSLPLVTAKPSYSSASVLDSPLVQPHGRGCLTGLVVNGSLPVLWCSWGWAVLSVRACRRLGGYVSSASLWDSLLLGMS